MQKIKIQVLGKFGVLKENEKLATEVLATQKQLFQKINELNRIKYELKESERELDKTNKAIRDRHDDFQVLQAKIEEMKGDTKLKPVPRTEKMMKNISYHGKILAAYRVPGEDCIICKVEYFADKPDIKNFYSDMPKE